MIAGNFSAAVRRRVFSDSARPLRFACVGAFAGVFQLGLFAILIRRGINPLAGNPLAFAVAVQVNFCLSSTFTWNGASGGPAQVARRWAAFHAACAGTAVLNFLVFMTVRHVTPDLVASAVGIASAALINYLANDRIIFALRPVLVRRPR